MKVTIDRRGGQRVYFVSGRGKSNCIKINGKPASLRGNAIAMLVGIFLAGFAVIFGMQSTAHLLPRGGRPISWFEWAFVQFMGGGMAIFTLVFGALGLLLIIAPLASMLPRPDSEFFLDATGLTRITGFPWLRYVDFFPFETIADVHVRAGCVILRLKDADKELIDLAEEMSEQDAKETLAWSSSWA